MTKVNVVLSFLVLCLCLLISSPQALAKNATLTVSGEGIASQTANRATIYFSVLTTAKEASAAQMQNANTSTQLHQALKIAGILEKDITTRDYSCYPLYNPSRGRTNEITGYNVSNTVCVLIRDVKTIGKIIDVGLKNGANRVNSLEFALDDRNAVRQKALTKAVQDAQNKAETIAAALGKKILGIEKVTEQGTYSNAQARNYMQAKMTADETAGATTPIEVDTVKVSATISIEYSLAP